LEKKKKEVLILDIKGKFGCKKKKKNYRELNESYWKKWRLRGPYPMSVPGGRETFLGKGGVSFRKGGDSLRRRKKVRGQEERFYVGGMASISVYDRKLVRGSIR